MIELGALSAAYYDLGLQFISEFICYGENLSGQKLCLVFRSPTRETGRAEPFSTILEIIRVSILGPIRSFSVGVSDGFRHCNKGNITPEARGQFC